MLLPPILFILRSTFCSHYNYNRTSFFRTSLIRISVYRDSESGRPTNKFKQCAPRELPEMPDRWQSRLVNTVFSELLSGISISEQFCRSKQKHNVSKLKIISFCVITMRLTRKFNLLCHKDGYFTLFALPKHICVIRTFSLSGQVPTPSSLERRGSSV